MRKILSVELNVNEFFLFRTLGFYHSKCLCLLAVSPKVDVARTSLNLNTPQLLC